MNNNQYCVIMAGGIGVRFWPLSREARPKQFLDILGTGRTFLQETYDRFSKIIPAGNIYVVTNKMYKQLVREQVPQIAEDHILLEPLRKNTAPCVAYASYRILSENPDAIMVVAPSDHLITREEEFLRIVQQGLEFVAENDALLTLGIKPSRPETGYGYIQVNGSDNGSALQRAGIRKVKTFTEKPNAELARIFYESGEFFWNAGIFLWSVKSIIKAFEEYLPEVNVLFAEGNHVYGTMEEEHFIEGVYPQCKSISVDYAIMEKADNVYVLCSDFGWSDIGTWGSLHEHQEKDEQGNSVTGDGVFGYNIRDCIINLPQGKLAVIEGLQDYIVVESDGILLICRKSQEQEIRQFVNDVKLRKGDQYM
ncbi:MAG: mannose-1-phosphate guanylyltransferase [Bacteroidales bacterium]|nr:mannose-1-phosphate guanylyltransferase [Bacteroidales bacterium]